VGGEVGEQKGTFISQTFHYFHRKAHLNSIPKKKTHRRNANNNGKTPRRHHIHIKAEIYE
jgi:hypothetical protein